MATVTVRVPYPGRNSNPTRDDLVAEAISRYFRRDLAWAEDYLSERLGARDAELTGTLPDTNGLTPEQAAVLMASLPSEVPVTLEVDDAEITRIRGELNTEMRSLSPELHSFIFGDSESGGDPIAADQLDDMSRVIDLAELMTPAEREAYRAQADISAGGGGTAEDFARSLDAFITEKRDETQALISTIDTEDDGTQTTSDLAQQIASLEQAMQSPLASAGIERDLVDASRRLREAVARREARANAIPLPELPRLSPEDENMRALIELLPGGDIVLDQVQLQEAMQGFANGAVRGYATEMPEAGHPELGIDSWPSFYGGYLYGIVLGVGAGIGSLVDAIGWVAGGVVANTPAGIAWDMINEGRGAYVERRLQEAQKVINIGQAIYDFSNEYEANPSSVGGDIGRVVGQILASEVDEFLHDDDNTKGQKIGEIVGAIVLEIVAEAVLAAATEGLGNAARAATALAQTARAAIGTTSYVARLRRVIESAPSIRRLLRRLNAAEDAGDLGRAGETAGDLGSAGRAADTASDAARGLDNVVDGIRAGDDLSGHALFGDALDAQLTQALDQIPDTVQHRRDIMMLRREIRRSRRQFDDGALSPSELSALNRDYMRRLDNHMEGDEVFRGLMEGADGGTAAYDDAADVLGDFAQHQRQARADGLVEQSVFGDEGIGALSRKGSWDGAPGETPWTPNSDELLQEMMSRGEDTNAMLRSQGLPELTPEQMTSIPFHERYPDFSAFAYGGPQPRSPGRVLMPDSEFRPPNFADYDNLTTVDKGNLRELHNEFCDAAFARDTGMTPEEVLDLRRTGLNPDEIQELQRGGMSMEDIRKAHRGQGWTWHHVENSTEMQLVPTEIHQRVYHEGGIKTIGG